MKKLVAILMVFMMVVSVTACGTNNTGVTTTTKATTTTAKPTTTVASTTAPDDYFVIGVSTTVSGVNSVYGLQALNAMNMALDYINANGGYNGIPGKIITYDEQSSPEEAVKIAQKFIQVDKVDAVIGSNSSSDMLASGSFYNDAKIFTIGMGTSANWMNQGWKYVSRCSMNNDFNVPMVVNMIEKLKITEVAVFAGQDDASISSKDIFLKKAPEQGITVIREESFDATDNDYSGQCARIVASKPQGVFIACNGDYNGMVVKQLRQAGYDGLIFSKESFYSALIEIAGPENADYVLFANPYVTYAAIEDCKIENMSEFLVKYTERYKEMPSTDVCYRGWDAMMVIWETTKLAGSNDDDAMVAALSKVKIQGLGGIMDYSNGDGEPYHVFNSFVLRNGENVLFDEWYNNGGYTTFLTDTGREH